jgi:hypothetical protein
MVIASKDDGVGSRLIDLMDSSQLDEIRETLRSKGIRLGETLQAAPRSDTQSSPASPLQVVAHGEEGKEHRLIADSVEEYSLSSGSTLYFLQIPDALCDCRWLIGHTLELSELAGSPCNLGSSAK